MTTQRKIFIARAVAGCADLIQIFFFPLFSAGFLSPLNTALDVLVAVVLIGLLGWHIAFLPTFILEQLPVADLAPTWTIAVWIATRGRNNQQQLSTGN